MVRPLPICPATGKVGFYTEKGARAALVEIVMRRNKGNESRRESDVYKCPDCKRWHLTSHPKKKRKTP